MKNIYSLLVLICFFSFSVAQSDCVAGRYENAVFSNFVKTADVTYGQNTAVNATTTVLKMDIYEPQGDTLSLRPLILMAHGGTFIGGDKAGTDIVPLAEDFSKKGYVCASINYRLGIRNFPLPGPDSTDATEAVVRAVQDAKAAIRFFYKDRATTNTYKIDTNRVYFLGCSAGGFIAIHYAYLDDISELPASIDTTLAGMGGGLEGLSGNPGYSSTIHGVINLAGAIGDSTWIKPGDQPCVSLHGSNDNTVPFGSTMLVLSGVWPLLEVDGSSSIHNKLDALGIENCFYPHWGAGHVPYVANSAYTDTTIWTITGFMTGLVCGTQPQCYELVVGTETSFESSIEIWPNPSESQLNLRISHDLAIWNVKIYDLSGKKLFESPVISEREIRIEHGLSPGIYILEFNSENKKLRRRISVR